ncbi:MAG: pyruvate dehydrogenase complex dihydrolipoamide acetyltransferase [Pyrinomonadaceae bacterium]
MPKLAPTMEDGQRSRWLKNDGDKVSVGEPLAEIDTDKATMEAQALTTGVLLKILQPAGSTVPLGDVIAIIGEQGEDISALVGKAESGQTGAENKQTIEQNVEAGQDGSPQEIAQIVVDAPRTQATMKGEAIADDVGGKSNDAQTGEKKEQAPETSEQKPPAQLIASAQPTSPAQSVSAPSDGATKTAASNGQQASGRIVISPIAARMAAEAGLNLQTLTGTGPGGRIIKRDIEAATAKGAQATTQPIAQQTQTAVPPQEKVATTQVATQSIAPAMQAQIQSASGYRDEPLTEIRKVIARRLTSSIGPVPHFFLTTEIEMDRVLELRRQLNEIEPDVKVSVNDIIIKTVANSLMQHRYVNASFQEKAIRFYEHADIGVAVAIEDGLITPVVRAADQKSIGQISREVRDMAERARHRRLKPEEYTGSTFSISNLGMFGIDEFTAIINPPEAAILAVGAATPKPVVRDGEVVVRNIMRVTMSSDHRVIDGATGAKFLQTLKRTLENPLSMLL